MTQKKIKENGKTFYEVTFTAEETKDFIDYENRPHVAKVFSTGHWFFVISIDGRPAHSLSYASPKRAVRNSWVVKA